LYRAIDPDHRVPDDLWAVYPVAFEDFGKSYESLSFFVGSKAPPSRALVALAPYRRAKKACKLTDREPTAGEMIAAGYTVARVSASFVLSLITESRGGQRPITIKREGNDDYAENGHLNLHNGRFAAQRLADKANGTVVLSKQEILHGP
jgi:hypothetical protein